MSKKLKRANDLLRRAKDQEGTPEGDTAARLLVSLLTEEGSELRIIEGNPYAQAPPPKRMWKGVPVTEAQWQHIQSLREALRKPSTPPPTSAPSSVIVQQSGLSCATCGGRIARGSMGMKQGSKMFHITCPREV